MTADFAGWFYSCILGFMIYLTIKYIFYQSSKMVPKMFMYDWVLNWTKAILSQIYFNFFTHKKLVQNASHVNIKVSIK